MSFALKTQFLKIATDLMKNLWQTHKELPKKISIHSQNFYDRFLKFFDEWLDNDKSCFLNPAKN